MVIWLCGLSGSGKSTVCNALAEHLRGKVPQLVVLDGDAVRAAFGNDLGYCEGDRVRQVGRIQRLAKLLSDQGLVVLVAVVYSRPDLLEWNRENISEYFEVLLDAPMELVVRRDSKGLYSRRLAVPHVVGVDIPWHRPESPDLVLEVVENSSPVSLAAAIARAIPYLSSRWAGNGD
jgi:adenylylsulfate kinase